jgi:hypothetical protein
MTPGSLATYWKQAAQLLGFTVEAPYVVALPDGRRITFPVRLPDFGAEHGMLLSDNYEDFASHAKAIVEFGYGYSVMTTPSLSDAPEAEDIIEVLQDWGWSASSTPPEWLGEA